MSRIDVDSRQVRRHFSCHAAEYDRYAVVQKRVVSHLLRTLADGAAGTALEVGCGTGALSRQLRERFPDLRLTVSDIAHGMSCHAAATVPGIAAVDADAQALPFLDGAFSLVLSASVYQWVNDLSRAFAESFRVMAPGGRFAFALFGERTLFELRDSHRLAASEAGDRPSHAQEFPSAAEVRRSLQASGFTKVTVQSVDEVEYHPDVSTLLRNLKRIGAQNAAGKRPGGLARRRVMKRMDDLYRERFAAADGIPATYEVIYASARKPS